MNAVQGQWRRLAARLAQHASWVLPGTRSPWADAMRQELDYIEDDPAALRWGLGCVLASYKARLAHRPSFDPRAGWRHAATSGEFPLVGHNVRGFSPCGARIVADFIDNPAQASDTACANRIAPIRFLPKDPAP